MEWTKSWTDPGLLITGLIWQREGEIKELRVYTKDRPWNLSWVEMTKQLGSDIE